MKVPFPPLPLIAALILLLALAPLSAAHEDVEKRIADLTEALREDAGDASLYLQRAEMLRHHGRWDEAFADLERAAALEPDLPGLTLASARVADDAGHRGLALELVDRQLAEAPGDPTALRQRARLLQQLARSDEALAAWNVALQASPAPQPDDYLARMEVALMPPTGGDAAPDARRRRVALALYGLDEGIAQLGDVPGLHFKAIELEQELGRHGAALARLDRLAAASARQDLWLVRRGDLLETAGRPAEARTVREQALSAHDRLPASHRGTRASLALRAALIEHLKVSRDSPRATSRNTPRDIPPETPR